MRIKVGNIWYNGEDQPILVELTEKDRENIANMHPECDKYCEYPQGTSDEVIAEFMETAKEPIETPGESV